MVYPASPGNPLLDPEENMRNWQFKKEITFAEVVILITLLINFFVNDTRTKARMEKVEAAMAQLEKSMDKWANMVLINSSRLDKMESRHVTEDMYGHSGNNKGQ